MTTTTVNLVPGRECGACTACCTLPAIDTPELRKPSGTLCVFCAPEQGCTIHATRPAVCRDWFCGWRSLPLLDDAWRPDRCGLLIVLGDDPIPDGLAPYSATTFVVSGDGAFLSDRRFLSYVSALVHARAATYLAVMGPPGHQPLKALLNPHLAQAAALRDGVGLERGVRRVFESLRVGPFTPETISEGAAPASAPSQPPPAM